MKCICKYKNDTEVCLFCCAYLIGVDRRLIEIPATVERRRIFRDRKNTRNLLNTGILSGQNVSMEGV